MNRTVTLSVVMPVYREAEHIERSLQAVQAVLVALDVPFEIICVDDGSPDETWTALSRACARVPQLKAIKLSRNFGKEGAMLAGLEASAGDAVIVMDCDLQHPPEIIPEMLRLWRTGYYKIINGVKAQANRRSRIAEAGARYFYAVFERLTGVHLANSSDFKLLDREVVNSYLALRERRLFFRAMTSWMGFSHAEVRFHVASRTAGASKFSYVKLSRMALESIVSFSPLLMYGAFAMGALFFLFSLAVGAHTIYLKLAGRAVEGFATTILIELAVGSTMLMGLGIIGLYIARIHEELKGRPRYLVEASNDVSSDQSLRLHKQDAAA